MGRGERRRAARPGAEEGGRAGAAVGPGVGDSARLRPTLRPCRRGSWKTSGEDGAPPRLLPSPAGRGSAPGWGGGGPDACDWPRPHLGRPAPPPPSCWEQLLLSPRGAALGRRARSPEPEPGSGWRRPGSQGLLPSRLRVRGTPCGPCGDRGRGDCARGGSCVAFQNENASSWRSASLTEPATWTAWRGAPRGLGAVRCEASAPPRPVPPWRGGPWNSGSVTRVGLPAVWTVRRRAPNLP